jgi:hypothetical protein
MEIPAAERRLPDPDLEDSVVFLTAVRYRTRPDRTAENRHLIREVFSQLDAAAPDRLRYLVLRLPDDTFLHLVAGETPADRERLTGLDAFRAFQTGVRDRALESPVVLQAELVGNYRMISE